MKCHEMVWYGENMWELCILTTTTKAKNIPRSAGVNTITKARGVLGLALIKPCNNENPVKNKKIL